jgi:hypothetical protein
LVVGIVLLASLVPPGFSAVRYYPGLKDGETAYYSLSGTYGYSQPVTQMSVLRVSGTNVTVSFFNFYPDGRLQPNIWIDVFSGQRYNFTSTFFFAIAAGLHLYDGIFNQWSNVTIVREGPTSACGGGSRLGVGSQFLSFSTGQQISAIWDEATGALCSYGATDFQGGRSLNLNMVNSTIFASPANPGTVDPYTVAAEISAFLGLPLVAIILFVYFRRKRVRK